MNGHHSPHDTQQTADAVFTDTAFDPQADFSFENSHQQDQGSHESMQSEMNEQNMFSQTNGFGSDDFSFSRDFLNGADDYSRSDALGQSLSSNSMWPNSASASNNFNTHPTMNFQNQIVQNRPGSVQQRFGHITPPDDMPNDLPSSKQKSSTEEVDDIEKLKSDKSQRARNAANQRHAKMKKQRRDSRQSMTSAHSDDEAVEDKKEKYREKNRVAAAKCRAKKKTNIGSIEDTHRDLNAMNQVLKRQVQELRGELTSLRTHALNHQDCNCLISRYNINQARKMTMGVDARDSPTGYGSFGNIQSPDMGGKGLSMSNLAATVTSPKMEDSSQSQTHHFPSQADFAFGVPEEIHGMHQGGDQFGDYMQSGFGGPIDFSRQRH